MRNIKGPSPASTCLKMFTSCSHVSSPCSFTALKFWDVLYVLDASGQYCIDFTRTNPASANSVAECFSQASNSVRWEGIYFIWSPSSHECYYSNDCSDRWTNDDDGDEDDDINIYRVYSSSPTIAPTRDTSCFILLLIEKKVMKMFLPAIRFHLQCDEKWVPTSAWNRTSRMVGSFFHGQQIKTSWPFSQLSCFCQFWSRANFCLLAKKSVKSNIFCQNPQTNKNQNEIGTEKKQKE